MTPNSTPVWPCGGTDKCLCGTAQDIRRQPEPHPVVELDAVNHPRHYTAHPSGVECIQITEHMGFCLGNAVKYIWRADEKGRAVEDLRKARWYLDREIARRIGAAMSNSSERSKPLGFDLRTRIAAALYQRYVRTLDVEYSCMEWEDIPDKEPWLADADAVIRELGLVEERVINGVVMWRRDDGYDTPHGKFIFAALPPETPNLARYVTEWVADE